MLNRANKVENPLIVDNKIAKIPQFKEFSREMDEQLVELLTSETWPFHGQEKPSADSIKKALNKGFYTENGNKTFWIMNEHKKLGLIRIFDLEDPTCLFDLRLKEKERGRGLGLSCVRWLTNYIFTTYPHIIRIEAHTRNDNFAMRKTLHKSGYVKEAYHRSAWPQGSNVYDSIGYAIVRKDWEEEKVTSIKDDFPF
ncbi:GNAT family N-acetyltransferase [Bacillus sp. Bva_UNVM-123]|uniref:GNAT family N-acetyltransferase n=1 Tax=Bacillus sp. Bva_UNVM-123 TaxID=2829798 RepID=UPI00391F8E6E